MKTVMELFSLENKIALVTGSASGIGQEIAVALAEAGADIIGIYNRTPAEETKARIEATGKKYVPLKADLSNLEAAQKVVADAVAQFGKIDILVNSAGVTGTAGVMNFDEKIYAKSMNINVDALIMLSVEVGKQMVEQGTGGRIINIASIAGVVSTGASVIPYVTSKHAVVGATKAMAQDLAPHGITVNAIAPGIIKTRMTAESAQIEAYIEQMVKASVPLKRWGKPEDFKGVAVLLASEAGSFITGQTYLVDGGYTII